MISSIKHQAKLHALPALISAYTAGMSSLSIALPELPSMGLGAVTSLFYSATCDMLAKKTKLPLIARHSIAILTSALLTYGVVAAAAAAGLIAMPPLASLGTLFAVSILTSIVVRALLDNLFSPPKQLPPSPPLPLPKLPDPLPFPGPKFPTPYIPAGPRATTEPIAPWAARPAAQPERWYWPSDLTSIGMTPDAQKEIDAFLKEALPEVIATKKMPDFHRKGEDFIFKGKRWRLPRTLTFIQDPKTGQLASVLLNVNKKVIGSGGQRTVKTCYNLTTGQRMVKKGAYSAYEVELLKSITGSKGIESLQFARVVPDKRSPGLNKTHLVTDLYEGNLDKLLSSSPHLRAKDVRDIALSLFAGLEKLHAQPGRTQFPKGVRHNYRYTSYHQDIKPANLLFKKGPEGYTSVICDMGTVNDLPSIWRSDGWISPEKYRAIRAHSQDAVAYNTRYGHYDDLWNMGLVLSCLLRNSSSHILGYRSAEHLDQGEINAMINQRVAPRETDSKAKAEMWKLVGQLLKVKPEERFSATQARKALELVTV